MMNNWAGNITYGAAEIHRPTSTAEVQTLVAGNSRVRALGTRHSFNDLADSPGVLVSLEDLPPVVEIDSAAATATVAAGLRYAEVARRLDERGYALRNLGSLPHISVVGACATATHGSGVTNGSLATSVRALDLVTASGDLVTLNRADDGFAGAVVSLGALGIVVSVTLDLVPSFDVRQRVYENLPLDVAADHFPDLAASAYSVSLFTDWRDAQVTQLWFKQRTDAPDPPAVTQPWFTATPAPAPRHPIPGMSPENCTEQQGVPGPWYDRLPHFRADFVPSVGDELQSEYMIARADAPAALHALAGIRDRVHPVLQISEIRTVAADDLWLSPFYHRDSVALHFTWISTLAAVLPAVRTVEEQLAPFTPRPHWGKIFTLPPDTLRSSYPRLPDFTALRDRYDPNRKFANPFTDRNLNSGGAGHW